MDARVRQRCKRYEGEGLWANAENLTHWSAMELAWKANTCGGNVRLQAKANLSEFDEKDKHMKAHLAVFRAGPFYKVN